VQLPVVLTITHSPTESVARLGGWLSAAGVLLDVRSPYDGSPLPSLRGFAGLLVMGGAMGAYDDDVAPWLPATRDLLREACERIQKTRSVKRIVYVSCDRPTLARDLDILASVFRVVSVDVFEMFPQTSHAETVVLLERTLPPK